MDNIWNYIRHCKYTVYPLIHTIVVLCTHFSSWTNPISVHTFYSLQVPALRHALTTTSNVHNRFTTQTHKVYHGSLHIFPPLQLLIAPQNQFTIPKMNNSFSNHADITHTSSPTSLTLSITTTFTNTGCPVLNNIQLSPWKYYFYILKQLCDPMINNHCMPHYIN